MSCHYIHSLKRLFVWPGLQDELVCFMFTEPLH